MSLVRGNIGVGVTNELSVATADTRGVRVRRLDAAGGRQVGVHWSATRALTPAARTLLREILAAPLPAGTEACAGVVGGAGTRESGGREPSEHEPSAVGERTAVPAG